MKREILCPDCSDKLKRKLGIRPSSDPFNVAFAHAMEEETKFKEGKLSNSCVCDMCSKNLDYRDLAVAVSYSSKAFPYYEWEQDYFV